MPEPCASNQRRIGRNMRRSSAIIPGSLIALWVLANLAPGPSTGGVELNSEPTASSTAAPADGHAAACERVHEYQARGWGGLDLVRSDVWLTACTNSSGQMRIAKGPTCSAASVLGRSSADCTSAPDGSDVRITLNVHFPFWVAWMSAAQATLTFRIDPGGGYNSQ